MSARRASTLAGSGNNICVSVQALRLPDPTFMQTSSRKARTPATRRKGAAVTIHEVAQRAGVSPMTVSRVVNGNANVRAATRELVMRTVRELNYTPNAAARSLAAASGTRIALIYTNPSSAYLSELLVGALDGASKAFSPTAPASRPPRSSWRARSRKAWPA